MPKRCHRVRSFLVSIFPQILSSIPSTISPTGATSSPITVCCADVGRVYSMWGTHGKMSTRARIVGASAMIAFIYVMVLTWTRWTLLILQYDTVDPALKTQLFSLYECLFRGE